MLPSCEQDHPDNGPGHRVVTVTGEIIVVLVIALALFFDFTNGFHDTANAMATPIATGALRPKVAVTIAAIATALRGEIARVETLVAIEFAVSWKPFVKSKNSATTTTAMRVMVIGNWPYAFLTRMFAITLAAVSQASSARSSAS